MKMANANGVTEGAGGSAISGMGRRDFLRAAAALSAAGHPPTSVHTTAKVHLDKVADGFAITSIDLETVATVPGICAADFQTQAEGAKKGCPISKLLTGAPIHLKATLV